MNNLLGAVLAAAFVALAYWQYGWQGAVFAVTATVFWMLLQFNRALRTMKRAAGSPVGHVGSAVMLNARLKPGLTLMQVIDLTRSLGRKLSDDPERYAWTDASGARVEATFRRGRCTEWSLHRDDASASEGDAGRDTGTA
ncbi:MAG TPA: hypothetical protein VFX50_12505 [Gemmatimonadales bacterium]|nr:hypothetical protein [Gemmatimonadales bacterium]